MSNISKMSTHDKFVDLIPIGGLESRIDWFNRNVRAAASLPEDSPFISFVIPMTAEFAAWLLEYKNTENRPIRPIRVEEFAQKVGTERWKLTSQGISISKEGMLNNGQHRLLAIAKVGIETPIYVTFGEDRTAFKILDTGAPRGGADTLHIEGFVNVTALAAAARLLKNILGGRPVSGSPISNDEIGDFIKKQKGLTDSIADGRKLSSKLNSSTAAMISSVYLIRSQSFRSPTIITAFIDRLIDGADLTARNPLLVLREALMKKEVDKHIRGAGGRQASIVAAVIKTWNYSVIGRKASTIQAFRWEPGEPFPKAE